MAQACLSYPDHTAQNAASMNDFAKAKVTAAFQFGTRSWHTIPWASNAWPMFCCRYANNSDLKLFSKWKLLDFAGGNFENTSSLSKKLLFISKAVKHFL